MREIEFRGNPKGAGKWVFGDFVQHSRGVQIWDFLSEGNNACLEVDPETVGQYTGLKDKKGAKIFEGDILQSHEYPFSREGIKGYAAVVDWDDETASFFYKMRCVNSNLNGISHGVTEGFDSDTNEMFEVIGNIHDNPELLGALQ